MSTAKSSQYAMLPISVSDKGVHVSRKRKTYPEGQDIHNLTVNEGRDVIAAIWQLCKLYKRAADSPSNKLWQNLRVLQFLDDKNSNRAAKSAKTSFNQTLNGSLNISAIQPIAPNSNIQELQEQLLKLQIEEAQEKLLVLKDDRQERSVMNQSSLLLKNTRQKLLDASNEAQRSRNQQRSAEQAEKDSKKQAKLAFKQSIAPLQALIRETRKIPVYYDPKGLIKAAKFTTPSSGDMAQWLREFDRQAQWVKYGMEKEFERTNHHHDIFAPTPSHDFLIALRTCLTQVPDYIPGDGFIRYMQQCDERIARQERAELVSTANLSNASAIMGSIEDSSTLKSLLAKLQLESASTVTRLQQESASIVQKLKEENSSISAALALSLAKHNEVVAKKKKGGFW